MQQQQLLLLPPCLYAAASLLASLLTNPPLQWGQLCLVQSRQHLPTGWTRLSVYRRILGAEQISVQPQLLFPLRCEDRNRCRRRSPHHPCHLSAPAPVQRVCGSVEASGVSIISHASWQQLLPLPLHRLHHRHWIEVSVPGRRTSSSIVLPPSSVAGLPSTARRRHDVMGRRQCRRLSYGRSRH